MSLKRGLPTPGEALLQAGLGEAALPYLEADHAAEPGRWEHLVNLGAAHRIAAHFRKARGCYLQAMDIKPDSPEIWHNYALLLEDEGQFAESRKAALRAFKLQPSQFTAMNLATSYLRDGDWEEGGALWVYARQNRSWHPIPGVQPWGGEPVEGKSILVMQEGGYGDAFLALQWMRELTERGAHVSLVLWDEMAPLMEQCWFIEEVLPRSKRFDAHKFDYQVPLLSLPVFLGLDPATIKPAGKLFDVPEPELSEARSLLANGGRKKVGLCWWAEENTIPRKFRTIPVEELEPLKHLDCRWINVTLEQGPEWVESKPLPSWASTAAIISQLDLVVTVDTAIAHLAGCLNVPCLTIVPLNVDWKWGLTGERVIWYESMSLIRNTEPLSFRPAVEMVAAKVKEFFSMTLDELGDEIKRGDIAGISGAAGPRTNGAVVLTIVGDRVKQFAQELSDDWKEREALSSSESDAYIWKLARNAIKRD